VTDSAALPTEIPPEAMPQPWRLRRLPALLIALAALAAMAAFFLVGWLPLAAQRAALADQAGGQAAARPRVRVAKPVPVPATITVSLPGTLAPVQQATLFTRASGYVSSWSHDLGEHVRKDEILARISSPDTDAQEAQAKATLAQALAQVMLARANAKLAGLTLDRQKALGPQLAAQQDIDTAQAGLDAANATVALDQAAAESARSDLQRLDALVGFEQVRAPFDGIITSRAVQVGSLVNGGNGAGQELFQISQTDPMLVFVDVPQAEATGIHLGDHATVAVRELGSAPVQGTVGHIAHLLDPTAHTMSVEVRLENHAGRLLSGMYGLVTMTSLRTQTALKIPANALVIDERGSRVGVLDRDDRVHMRDITIVEDTGTELMVSAGLAADERVALNPGENISDGVVVEVIPEEAEDGAAAPQADPRR
jgi:membrane fusion protein (multidrug efflux system)